MRNSKKLSTIKSKTYRSLNPMSITSKRQFNNTESSTKQWRILFEKGKDNLIIWLLISKTENNKITKILKGKEDSHRS